MIIEYTDILKIEEVIRTTSSISKKNVLPIISAFDIETTRLKDIEQSFMYVWQWCFAIDNIAYVIIGRTWSDFIKCAKKVHHALGDKKKN